MGSTIPKSWSQSICSIQSIQKKPVVIFVLGKADSGKTSYCTFLVNSLLAGSNKVAILDGDLGQSDIGPSGSVGYALTSKQVIELYDLKLENAFFVGAPSPVMAMARTIEGLTTMLSEILRKAVDFVIINSDGWVQGDIAVRYKTALIQELKPDVIAETQVKDELKELTANLNQLILVVESSLSLNQRTPEKRKLLREMTYSRYLKNAKLHCYPLGQLIVEPRNALRTKLEPKKGLLLGLYRSGNEFLGVGVLREINHERRTLKVQTAVSAEPSRIVMGQIFLDEKYQEIQD